ncbi:hypothetical protein AKO1_014657 [Acrasis kona]|uniref:Uncharacterized protein n=1 Tax=Acrasis kona TaxID=1008807 RepID=A0AAW2Z1Z0_9EUKA
MEGKVALVTGGATGIGKAICIQLCHNRCKVAVCDMNEEVGRQTVKELNSQGGEAIFIKVDVTKSEEVQNMVKSVIDKFGRIDYAVNNAGVGGSLSKTENYSESLFDNIMDINLKGVFLCLKYQLKQMVAQGGKGCSIVNTSSISGLSAYRMNSPYSASKFGVVGLTKSTAIEYARMGIRVNCVCPTFTQTAMLPDDKKLQENLIERVPLHRLGTPDDVANAVMFLLSEQSSFITGVALPLCGGLSAL